VSHKDFIFGFRHLKKKGKML